MAVAASEMDKLSSLSKQDNFPQLNFNDFLNQYKSVLDDLFNNRLDPSELNDQWTMPEGFLDTVLGTNPLSVYVEAQYGGFGANIQDGLSLLEASSYHSLPLSLMIGINGALFLQPVGAYAAEDAKKEIFTDFLSNQRMGGMMITEPNHGSDALKMKTCFEKSNGSYRVQGLKHWGGLTGKADYWLVAAREKKNQDRLGKDIGFFVHPTRNNGIEVLEYYKNLGLRFIPYGKNQIDFVAPDNYRLLPRSSGLKMLTDILHRSRLQFPGMGMGFLKRLMESGMEHCEEREVGGKNLNHYEQVKRRLFCLQSNFTVCSAMCAYTTDNAGIDQDLSDSSIQANSVKALVTDYMQEGAQSLMQLFGAKGYTISSLAGRSLVDSRPFQIFEGSNDILYQQITEAVLKAMKKMKTSNIYEFLCEFELTKKASEYFKEQLSFEVSPNLAQDKLVELGRILARVVSLEFTINLGASGFNKGLVSGAIENLSAEVSSLLTSYKSNLSNKIFEDLSATRWQSCVPSAVA